MGKKLSAKLRVRSYELDAYGHVNNATYLQYLEFARGEYMKQMGIIFKHDMEDKIRFFVVGANLNFKAPASIDEELEIKGKVIKLGNTSFTIKQDIYKTENNIHVLDADVTIVFINENDKPTRIPQYYRDLLEPFYEKQEL